MEKCSVGMGIKVAPVLAWKKKSVPSKAPKEGPSKLVSGNGNHNHAARAPDQGLIGRMGDIQKADSEGDWHELHSSEAFDLVELRVPPDIATNDFQSLECSGSK
ncbi:hypothetical protein Dimus_022069 [Dionaea muscipula]